MGIEKIGMLPKGPKALLTLQMVLFGLELYIAAPLAVAYFP
jgi:hypothetical protein